MLNYNIETVRNLNPLLAYLLEVVKPRWVPRVYTVATEFDTGTIGTDLDTGLAKPMASDAWLYDLEYSIRIPNNMPGSPFRPQFEFYNLREPYIDIDLYFTGAGPTCDIRVTNAPTPIQHVCRVTGGSSERFSSAVHLYHIIWKDQDLRTHLWLRRALDPTNEIPMTVTVVAKMLEVDRCDLCKIKDSEGFLYYFKKCKDSCVLASAKG